MIATLSRPRTTAAIFVAMASAASLAVAAETPADSSGRFTMSPVDGGFLRLDTQTGDVSLCTKTSESWVCEPVKDTGSTVEALQEENQALKEHIKSLEEGASADNGSNDQGFPKEPPKGSRARLPSDKDIDQAFDYVERMYRKLRERIEKLDKMPAPPQGDSCPCDKSGKTL